MDATIANEILSTIAILANFYYKIATQFDIDLQIVAFIIDDEFLSTTKQIVFVNN